MTALHFDVSAPKKATNLSINADLLRQAKELNINLSQTLEQHLAEIVRKAKRQQWLEENQEALEMHNRRVETNGVFSDGLRQF
jgi:antitoxin CcdA